MVKLEVRFRIFFTYSECIGAERGTRFGGLQAKLSQLQCKKCCHMCRHCTETLVETYLVQIIASVLDAEIAEL